MLYNVGMAQETKADIQERYDKLFQQYKILVVNEAHYKKMYEDTLENFESLLFKGVDKNRDREKEVVK